jgi:hypothetical protein
MAAESRSFSAATRLSSASMPICATNAKKVQFPGFFTVAERAVRMDFFARAEGCAIKKKFIDL